MHTTVAVTIRPCERPDFDQVRRVNAENVPEVGVLDDDRLELFAESARVFDVVEIEHTVAGIFVGLSEGLPYESPNYRWFTDRYERFAYVDRIALRPELRGLGVADALYDAFEGWATWSGRPVACAEVNVEPPNARSLRFHERRGFAVIGELAPYGPEERVAMVAKHLSGA